MELKQLVKLLLIAGGESLQNEFFTSAINPESSWSEDSLAGFKEVGITVKHLDNQGGEDMGREYYSVYSFEKDGEKVFVKFDGWYASHYGSEFTEFRFVEAKQETITVYR